MNRHFTEDELVDRLYGLNEDRDHLAACRECSARSEALEARRRESARAEPASLDFLAEQRRKIYARLEEHPNRRLRWLPAMVAAGALAAVAVAYRPMVPPTPHSDPGDAQLFSEVYSMEQSVEPTAAAPIHGLFEDDGQ